MSFSIGGREKAFETRGRIGTTVMRRPVKPVAGERTQVPQPTCQNGLASSKSRMQIRRTVSILIIVKMIDFQISLHAYIPAINTDALFR